MKKKFGFILIVFLWSLFACFAQKSGSPEYKLNVIIEPVSGNILCKVKIHNPGDSCFILTNGMKITKLKADGKSVVFHQKVFSGEEYSNVFTIGAGIPHELVIEYNGRIVPESYPYNTNSLNMIREGLVELSDHIKWFPVMKNAKPFLYQLELDMPAGYESVTSLELKKESYEKGRKLTIWESSEPSYGITIVSAKDFKMRSITRNGITLGIYYKKLPVSYIDSMEVNLMKSIELLTDLFGSPGARRNIRIIYSPRGAGGYARAPLILVSENFAMEQRKQKYGQARDFRLNTHELAHYWSRARTDTPDDWINEGLAEYSAYTISGEIFGRDFSGIILNEYKDIVNSSDTKRAIADTPAGSPDREVNRYYKPTLFLNDLHEKFGDAKQKEFFKILYNLFDDHRHATTEDFLEAIEKAYDKNTRDSVYEILYRKDQRNTGTEIPYISVDSAFSGKWTGPLSQFGTTVKFILNINLSNGKVIPTLDSPDQNVTGIPVSDLKMNQDSISFRIGVASAAFSGRLDRINSTINGEFRQRGGIFPLNLQREKIK